MKEDRRAVIRISKEALEMILMGCKYGYTSTLPSDLEVIEVLETDRLAARSTQFRIVVQSESFESVLEGAPIPEITPAFTRLEYRDQIKDYIDRELQEEADRHAVKEGGYRPPKLPRTLSPSPPKRDQS